MPLFLGTSANESWPNWSVIQPGSSMTAHSTGSNYYLNAVTNVSFASGGLAGTGNYYILGSKNSLFTLSRVLTAGSSVTTHTDSTNFYINATTSIYAGSAGLAGTGACFAVWSDNGTLFNEKLISAGTSILITTDATSVYINALVKDENYYRNYSTNSATALSQALYPGGGANNASALGTQAMAINTVTAVHFVVTKNMRIDTMALLCTATVAGCLVRIGIYTNSADNVLQPFQLVSTSGQIAVTPNILSQFQVNQTLSANNLYWFLLDVGTGAATVRTIPLEGAYPILGIDSGIGSAWKVALNTGKLFQTAWPATWGRGWGFVTMASIPALCVRPSI